MKKDDCELCQKIKVESKSCKICQKPLTHWSQQHFGVCSLDHYKQWGEKQAELNVESKN